jgi:hypothetical protein
MPQRYQPRRSHHHALLRGSPLRLRSVAIRRDDPRASTARDARRISRRYESPLSCISLRRPCARIEIAVRRALLRVGIETVRAIVLGVLYPLGARESVAHSSTG